MLSWKLGVHGSMCVLVLAVLLAVYPASARSDSPASDAAAQQVSAGKAQYANVCSVCHGQNLAGRDPAPALVGNAFMGNWAGRQARDLFERIRSTMPLSAPHSLSDEVYTSIVAYILDANGNAPAAVLDQAILKNTVIERSSE